MFEISTSKSYDAGKLELGFKTKNSYEFIGRTQENYGVQGYINLLDRYPNDENTISVSQIGSIHAQLRLNKWYASQNIFILKPKRLELVNLFISAAINKTLEKYGGYTNYPTLDTLKNDTIQLPTKNGRIDFEFMESFVAELEAQRVAELEAYLKVTDLDDYELTIQETSALEEYGSLNWEAFKMNDLFTRISTKKLPYKAKELPQVPTGEYVLPCLTSSFMNQGLNYYVPVEGATVLKNVISIPSNSDVYRAYFQSNDFTVLSDAYCIKWKYNNREITNDQYLFFVQSINKVTDLPIYSYKNKLGGWNKVKEKYIKLPVRDGEIDYDYMEVFVRAVKKLAIKDVVIWTDKKIEATKQVVNR